MPIFRVPNTLAALGELYRVGLLSVDDYEFLRCQLSAVADHRGPVAADELDRPATSFRKTPSSWPSWPISCAIRAATGC